MNRRLNAAAVAAVFALAAGGVRADDFPGSVLSLFNRIPELRATSQETKRWVDPQGKVVHPGLAALKADIQVHQRAVERIGTVAGHAAPHSTPARCRGRGHPVR